MRCIHHVIENSVEMCTCGNILVNADPTYITQLLGVAQFINARVCIAEVRHPVFTSESPALPSL